MAKIVMKKIPILRRFPAKGHRFICQLWHLKSGGKLRARVVRRTGPVAYKSSDTKEDENLEFGPNSAVDQGQILTVDESGSQMMQIYESTGCGGVDGGTLVDSDYSQKKNSTDGGRTGPIVYQSSDTKKDENLEFGPNPVVDKGQIVIANEGGSQMMQAHEVDEQMQAHESIGRGDVDSGTPVDSDYFEEEKSSEDNSTDDGMEDNSTGVVLPDNEPQRFNESHYIRVTDVYDIEKIWKVIDDWGKAVEGGYKCHLLYPSYTRGDELREIQKFCSEKNLLCQEEYDDYTTKKLSWNRPVGGCKLNVHGGLLGIGGLIRNERGTWIRGFTGIPPQPYSPILAQVRALHVGLQIARRLDKKGIKIKAIEVDEERVRNLALGDPGCGAISGKLEQIHDLLTKFTLPGGAFKSISPSANFCARLLAGITKSGKLEEFKKPPVLVKYAVEIDSLARW
ncbi:hypothetical protein ACH5RR_008987 [Cinchona calisaya]|uniref:RNase H type-1 domain-containing protein n=1 Tax=Cinchona calisaya TaxID=153742 RepID=A0ABD3AGU3_9GENT